MKPVDQTTFGHPGGNCFSACIASLLEMSIEDVPYFMESPDWHSVFREWLHPLGFDAMIFGLLDAEGKPLGLRARPMGLHILSGQSPRSSGKNVWYHSVIARRELVVHDPHPSRAGLLSDLDVTLLFPLDVLRPRMSVGPLRPLARAVPR